MSVLVSRSLPPHSLGEGLFRPFTSVYLGTNAHGGETHDTRDQLVRDSRYRLHRAVEFYETVLDREIDEFENDDPDAESEGRYGMFRTDE
jgi:hypothetical protein